jgi:hypothetical protein
MEEKHRVISVYVMVDIPPKIIHGKTPKGDRLVKQQHKSLGPFTLTRETEWRIFLRSVAKILDTNKENLDINAVADASSYDRQCLNTRKSSYVDERDRWSLVGPKGM